MLTLILRRLLLVLPNLFLLTFLLFASITTLLGSPAAMMLGEEASPQAIRELNQRFGFDRPVLVQYADWVWNALRGDFGRSFTTQQAVADAVLPRVPVTLELALWSIALAVLVATTINTVPVAKPLVGTLSSTLSILGITVPNFMLGIVLIYVFSVQLRWLPTTGWVPWSEGALTHLRHIIMPVLTLSAFYIGSFSLVYRAEYRDVMQRLFIKVARAKGLSETRVAFGHALPNSILPVVTYVGVSMGQLAGGAVVTETVFSVPGIGRLFVDSIGSRDFPVMLAVGMMIIVAVMLTNLVADLVYTIVNPQIRLS
jgi:peptide/nickel transport system permease protein